MWLTGLHLGPASSEMTYTVLCGALNSTHSHAEFRGGPWEIRVSRRPLCLWNPQNFAKSDEIINLLACNFGNLMRTSK